LLSILGEKAFRVIKKISSRSWDIIRYNPLVRQITAGVCFSAVVIGATFLVFFAVAAPELPPENLVSTIRDVSVNQETMESPWYHVILSSDEDEWVALTSFDDAGFETGTGSQDRSRDIEYPVRPGETLSEIAYSYGIPYDFLAWYNKITNANRIRVGTVIIIPSLENTKRAETQYRQQRTRQTAAPAKTTKSIQISYENHNNGMSIGSGITVQFSVVNPPSGLRSYEWDLGDGKRSFRESPSYEYSNPKTYVVRLTAQDNAGVIYRSNPLYIDIPHPASAAEYSTTKFVTLSSPDDHFVVNGTIIKVAQHANIEAVLDLSESDTFLTKAKFKSSGYYGVTVREEAGRDQFYSVFVSPIPTMHVDNAMSNFNWYRTQFNTGTTSNCGPASASMAIGWGTGKYFPVSSVRQAVGWQGVGGTSFDELLKVIHSQGVSAAIQPLQTVQNIRDVIDSGAIAIILFHTDGVRSTRQSPAADLFGKYYNDSTGHYIVVKGYSLNGEYLVIHDPIPSDWGTNSFRYGDEISMIGRNRYFLASEVLHSLRRGEMIVVPGQY
jgi:LysM repeat protein